MSLSSRPRLQLIKIYQWRDKVPNKKNIIIVIKKSICKVSQNCLSSASINQTLLFCCAVFYLVFFCFASFLIIVSDCIDESVVFLFYCLITIIKFSNKLVTINFESSKYKKDFHLSPPNILLVSYVNSSRKFLNTPSIVQ